MKTVKNYIPKIYILFLVIFSSCSDSSEKYQEVKKQQIEPAHSTSIARSLKEATASMAPDLMALNGDVTNKELVKRDVSKEELEIRKEIIQHKVPLQKLLNANVSFTENKGQLERFQNVHCTELDQIKFYSKAFGGTAYFATNGIGFGFKRGTLEDTEHEVNNTERVKLPKSEYKTMTGFYIEFLDCNKDAEVSGIDVQPTKINYLKGNDPDRFITDISSYKQVQYKNIYNGINLLYYIKDDQLKYDYILSPNSDVKQIRMNYKQVKDLQINKNGELEISINWGILLDKKPYSYQIINGIKKEVTVSYKKIDDKTIGFDIKGKYDKSKELIIDPFTVAWSTYIGSATSDDGYVEATVIDNSNRVLGTGWTNNAFPISASPNGYDQTYNGGTDAYVFRLNAAGSAMDYITFLGGGGNETGTGIAINSAGNICVSGHTGSYSQTTLVETSAPSLNVVTGVQNVTVANIGSYGNPQDIQLVSGAKVMNGTITGFANATTLIVNITSVTGSGTATNWSISAINQLPFPSTSGSIQPNKTGVDGNEDIFYLILNGSANNMIYGTHYGGTASNVDWAIDMVLDASNNAYITGRTQTTTGFSTAGVYKTAAQGGFDGYVLKINSAGTLGYCTYVGGAGNDMGKGIVVTSANEVLITGMTSSSGLGSGGVYQNTISGGDDAFLLKLTSTGTLNFFTYIGGTASDGAAGIDLIPGTNESIIVGATASSNFPLLNAVDNVYTAEEGFVARFNATGTALVYSSFIGGDGSDAVKGFDYTTVHKSAGVKQMGGKPVIVLGIASTAASMSTFIVSPISFTAVNQPGPSTYTYNGANFGGLSGVNTLGDFFLTVLNVAGTSVQFGSYFGGASYNDYPTAGINILQSSGCVVFGGGVHSLPFPVTSGAFQTQRVNSNTPDQGTIMKVCLPEILPVDYMNFQGNISGEGVNVIWSTTSEKNSNYFNVERSTDGKHFYSIGTVKAVGNTNEITNYTFTDNNPGIGNNYYRLNEFDTDGTSHFSNTIKVGFGEDLKFFISPNPGDGYYIAEALLTADAEINISVVNPLGQEILNTTEAKKKGNCKLIIDLQKYASGVYIVKISTGSIIQTEKVVKK